MKIIRDNLHGDIEFYPEEMKLLHTAGFERLHGCRQLGLSHLIYPGAKHARFEHVLGVMYVADKIAERMKRFFAGPAGDHLRRVLRFSALLHDMGHVPFGHTLEDEMPIIEKHDHASEEGKDGSSRMDQTVVEVLRESQNDIYIEPVLQVLRAIDHSKDEHKLYGAVREGRTLSFSVSSLSPTLPISSALLPQKPGVYPLWSNQSRRSFASSTSFTSFSSFSSVHRPFTSLLPHFHPSFSFSCHNEPQSGVQLIHHVYRYPNAYGTLLPMRSARRDPLMKRVLIIEDDRDIVELVRYNLANEGFQVNAAFDGSSGLSTLKKTPPDLLLLDLMLPKMSGLDICREIRKDESLNRLPVLMLTARGDEADRVVGLEMGADDYVTKPFSPRELIARVKALLRRAEPPVDSPRVIEIGRLAIDPASYRVSHSGKPVPLSTLEFRLLYYLASRPNRVFTRDQLLDAVWGTDRFVTPRSVDVYVRRLREKIESDPENPLHLKTVRGAGYLFETRAA